MNWGLMGKKDGLELVKCYVESDMKDWQLLTVAAAAASGCRYKADVESGAVVEVGEYSIIELRICVAKGENR